MTVAIARDPLDPAHRHGVRPVVRRSGLGWALFVVVVLGLGALLAVFAQARPAYDANGWMVWANEVLHGTLNLNAAPSWKPLAFLFLLPYALTGHQGELWLWTITACAGGVAGPLLAGRLAWRLAPRGSGIIPEWVPPMLAALVAATILATMTVASKLVPLPMGLLRQVLITSSDPLVLALLLGAAEAHFARRYGWALALLWLAGLGRPEVWVLLGGYGLWLWRAVPGLRGWWLAAVLSTPVAWFLPPTLASNSPLSPGRFDTGLATAVVGNKFLGVLDRVRTLSGTVVQIEVGVSLLLSLLWRDRRVLVLLGLAALWTAVEIGFALHGFSAVQRYLIEVGGVLAVIGGVGSAQLLLLPWRLLARQGRVGARLGAALGLLVVLIFLAGIVPFARTSVDGGRGIVENQQLDARELAGLTRLVRRAGVHQILNCGAPVAALGWQSGVAWELGINVGVVGFRPLRSYRTFPVVAFSHTGPHWRLTLLNEPTVASVACAPLQGLSS